MALLILYFADVPLKNSSFTHTLLLFVLRYLTVTSSWAGSTMYLFSINLLKLLTSLLSLILMKSVLMWNQHYT